MAKKKESHECVLAATFQSSHCEGWREQDIVNITSKMERSLNFRSNLKLKICHLNAKNAMCAFFFLQANKHKRLEGNKWKIKFWHTTQPNLLYTMLYKHNTLIIPFHFAEPEMANYHFGLAT